MTTLDKIRESLKNRPSTGSTTLDKIKESLRAKAATDPVAGSLLKKLSGSDEEVVGPPPLPWSTVKPTTAASAPATSTATTTLSKFFPPVLPWSSTATSTAPTMQDKIATATPEIQQEPTANKSSSIIDRIKAQGNNVLNWAKESGQDIRDAAISMVIAKTTNQPMLKPTVNLAKSIYKAEKPVTDFAREKVLSPVVEKVVHPVLSNVSKQLENLSTKSVDVGKKTGDVLGKIMGGFIGATMENVTSKELNPVKRVKDIWAATKKNAEATAPDVSEMIGTAFGFYPTIFKTSVDIADVGSRVAGGNPEPFINYAAEKLKAQMPVGLFSYNKDSEITLEQARNYLLTGNYEGDITKIDNKEVVKAWYAALLSTGLELWMAASLATSALEAHYKKNP
jgi:hypothetical protein